MEYKEAMGVALKSINDDLRGLKKRQKAAKEANKPDFKLNDAIHHLESQKKFYMATKAEPARFENGVVVNAKLVKAYLKKLPRGAVITNEFSSEGLTIRWKTATGQGGLVCLDLAHRYQSFTLPAAEGLFEETLK